MIFVPVPIEGASVIELEPVSDERGVFVRTWCARELESQGLNPHLAQSSVSLNRIKGTLRGMHLQAAPHMETKIVRCSSGAIYDVILDLRRSSSTYCKWWAIELAATNYKMLYIPEGVAHGFQTLANDTEVSYHISEGYHPEDARGVRWNDPAFGIKWPIADPIVSLRDRSFPDYTP
jgi:dTDP-4-dehydrorhamnose 3,5-epimerase